MERTFDETDKSMQEKYREGHNLVELSGCTATVLLVQEDYFVVANCGDSPIYIFRDNRTELLKVE
jgi:serine/threonine protein phosphatase PrpC